MGGRESSRTALLCCGLVLVLMTTGCSLLGCGNARLSGMIPGMSKRMDKLECWLTIEFKKYPENIDLQDVKVVFSSIALHSDETYDWAYIAGNNVIPQGLGKGFAPNEASVPGMKPPLEVPVKVRFPLSARPSLDLDLTETIWLSAELFWGGKSQGRIEKTIEHVYQRTLETRDQG